MTYRITLTVCVTLLCGLFQQSFSQVNYQPGYVIHLQGDTLKGYIDYRNWEKNPRKIAFSRLTDSPRQEFGPLDIRSFSVSGDLYEGAIVDVETSTNNTQYLDYGPEMHVVKDTVFARALVLGEKSLYIYHYTDGIMSKEQFYIRQGDRLELLQFKVYKTDHDGVTVAAYNNFYINQIAFYLGGCATIQNKLRGLKYNSQQLKRVFDAYYACTQTQMKFEEKKEKYPLEIGVLLGGTRSQVSFSSISTVTDEELTGQAFSPGYNFTGGFFFDLIKPRNHRKWSFNNELVYTAYKAERTYYKGTQSASSYDYYYTRLKYAYIKVNSMIRFKYPVGNAYIFINAGISNGYMLSGSDYLRHVIKPAWTDKETVTESKPFTNGVRKYEFGFLGGLGVRYRRYALEGRYESTGGMLDYIGLQATVSKTSLLLSYRFTK